MNNLKVYIEQAKHEVLTRDEEIQLCKKKEAGDQSARNDIISHNLLLVVSIAKRYGGRGLSMDDLICEGNFGLIEAVDTFDWRRNCRFSTHATSWIKRAIFSALWENRLIRLPSYLRDKKRVKIDAFMPSCVSLSRDNEKDHWSRPADNESVTDLRSLGPCKFIEAEEEIKRIVDEIRIFLAVLREMDIPERDKRIFEIKNKLFGNTIDFTLEDIGKNFNLTRERVRQIVLSVWRKLAYTGIAIFSPETLNLAMESLENLICIINTTIPNIEPTSEHIKRARKIVSSFRNTSAPQKK